MSHARYPHKSFESVPDLTLDTLNEATQAWAEYEYNRQVHRETGQTPLERYLAGPEVCEPVRTAPLCGSPLPAPSAARSRTDKPIPPRDNSREKSEANSRRSIERQRDRDGAWMWFLTALVLSWSAVARANNSASGFPSPARMSLIDSGTFTDVMDSRADTEGFLAIHF